MRLFLLPISTRRTLIYCDRSSLAKQVLTDPAKQPPLIDRLSNKASATWSSWEEADKGWKKQVTIYGNAALRRIPYQEWGLKSIPALTSRRREELLKPEKREEVEILFPGQFLREDKIAESLQQLAVERQPLHRKRFWGSLIGAPLTLPFALIPVIPNIPGFYLLFRAYSHWKAWEGAKHLEFLTQNKLWRPTPSPVLDRLYTAGLLHSTRQKSREAPEPTNEDIAQVSDSVDEELKTSEEVMLLRGWNGKLIAEEFKLPEMEVEIERAVEQVEQIYKDSPAA